MSLTSVKDYAVKITINLMYMVISYGYPFARSHI